MIADQQLRRVFGWELFAFCPLGRYLAIGLGFHPSSSAMTIGFLLFDLR